VYDGSYAPLRGVSMSSAYQSTLNLSFDVRGGLFMRQLHHWAALLFVASIMVHLMRIFFTGAFRRPREINWLVGIGLLLLALAMGITGYSLPDDLLSGTGLRVIYSVVIAIPFIGPYLAFLVFGGEFPTSEIISRLFVFHVMLLPALLIGGVLVHLGIDTVNLDGAGFELLAAEGDRVEAGTPVIRWDPARVEAGGMSPVCPVIALDADAQAVAGAVPGRIEPGAELFRWSGVPVVP